MGQKLFIFFLVVSITFIHTEGRSYSRSRNQQRNHTKFQTPKNGTNNLNKTPKPLTTVEYLFFIVLLFTLLFMAYGAVRNKTVPEICCPQYPLYIIVVLLIFGLPLAFGQTEEDTNDIKEFQTRMRNFSQYWNRYDHFHDEDYPAPGNSQVTPNLSTQAKSQSNSKLSRDSFLQLYVDKHDHPTIINGKMNTTKRFDVTFNSKNAGSRPQPFISLVLKFLSLSLVSGTVQCLGDVQIGPSEFSPRLDVLSHEQSVRLCIILGLLAVITLLLTIACCVLKCIVKGG